MLEKLKFACYQSDVEARLPGTNWVAVDEFRLIMRRMIYKMDLYLSDEEFERLVPISNSPLVSWWGDVLVAEPEEEWPYNGSNPLMPLCQLNLTEMPFLPQSLSDIAMVTIFIDPDDMPVEEYRNGDKWLIRTYSQMENLVPIHKPSLPEWEVEKKRPYWRFVEDFPNLDEMVGEILPVFEDCEDWTDYRDQYESLFEHHFGTKVGGYPHTIQGPLHWGPYTDPIDQLGVEYVLQIDSDGGWMWGDSGIAHLGRHRKDRDLWFLNWACC